MLYMTRKNKKKGFSLIELIFSIVIIGILASVALPNFTSINSKASIATIKQDTNTIITSLQSYYLVNNKIDKISDAITLNDSIWVVTDKKITYLEDKKTCLEFIVSTKNLQLSVYKDSSDFCAKLSDEGIKSNTFSFN